MLGVPVTAVTTFSSSPALVVSTPLAVNNVAETVAVERSVIDLAPAAPVVVDLNLI